MEYNTEKQSTISRSVLQEEWIDVSKTFYFELLQTDRLYMQST